MTFIRWRSELFASVDTFRDCYHLQELKINIWCQINALSLNITTPKEENWSSFIIVVSTKSILFGKHYTGDHFPSQLHSR